MSAVEFLLLGFCAFAAGFCNVIAGGGSVLVVPLMIMLGLPATVANATLRPAILFQTLVALRTFKRSDVLDGQFLRNVLPLVAVALPAAVAGAWLVTTRIKDGLLEDIIAVGFVGLALMMWFWSPRRRLSASPVTAVALAAAAGFYGGFIQIGVGFILTAALLIGRPWEMAQAHAAKVTIVLFYTAVTLPTFVLSGDIDGRVALVLCAGMGAGGFLGSRFAARADGDRLKILYVVLMLAFAIILLVR